MSPAPSSLTFAAPEDAAKPYFSSPNTVRLGLVDNSRNSESLCFAERIRTLKRATPRYAACEHDRGFTNHLRKLDLREAEGLDGADAFPPSGSTFFNVPRLPPVSETAAAAKSDEASKLRAYPAILIDPYHRSVKSVEVTGALESLQAAIGGCIQPATEFSHEDILYVDEEGLLKHRLCFEIDGQSFPGRGLIVGSHGDDMAAVKCRIEDVTRRVKFSEPDPKLGTNRIVVVPA